VEIAQIQMWLMIRSECCFQNSLAMAAPALPPIKPASDSDFEQFIKEAKGNEGWTSQYDSPTCKVWDRSVFIFSIYSVNVVCIEIFFCLFI
jgi:hypothetical protein